MPPRDEQEYEQRRRQILEGALEVFAQKGFEKATNKDIAEAAGIGSPGLIYHYFSDKADLLRQIFEQRVPIFQIVAHPESFLEMPPHEALTLFARTMLQAFEDRSTMSRLKLLLGEATRQPDLAELVNKIAPQRGFALLSRYLEHQMELGTLRRVDVGAAVRCFMGPMLAYVITREIFPQSDTETLQAETMATTLVKIYLQGMQVESAE